jgi:hypothetical protein
MYDFALDMLIGWSLSLCDLSVGPRPGGDQRPHFSEVAKCKCIPLLDQPESNEVSQMAFPEGVCEACYFCSQRGAIIS